MAKLSGLLLLVICCLILPFTWQKRFEPTWKSLDTHVAPSWYDEAKFGIFMTWGLYSVPSFSNEWFWNNWKGQIKKILLLYVILRFVFGICFCFLLLQHCSNTSIRLRKFYIRRNNNKVTPIETGHIVIFHLLLIKFYRLT